MPLTGEKIIVEKRHLEVLMQGASAYLARLNRQHDDNDPYRDLINHELTIEALEECEQNIRHYLDGRLVLRDVQG